MMDRRSLARIAHEVAADRLVAAYRAGQISREYGRAKLDKLDAAYRQRVSNIDLSDWLAARGLTNIVRIAA